MLIDTHAHMSDRRFRADLRQVAVRARELGIDTLVCIADRVETSRRAIEVAKRHSGWWATAGYHPGHESAFSPRMIDQIEELARNERVVAIGEAGLDFHWEPFDKARQIEILERQARLATRLALPLVLHCRKAYPELISLFESSPEITARGIVHCFSGDEADARRLIDLGFYLGVGGTATYPASSDLREIVKCIGLERIVLETDAPYLAPQPRRGRRNEPAHVWFVAEILAKMLGLSFHEVAETTSRNARAVYGLDERATLNGADIDPGRLDIVLPASCNIDACPSRDWDVGPVACETIEITANEKATARIEQAGDLTRFEWAAIRSRGETLSDLEQVLSIAAVLKSKGARVRIQTLGWGAAVHGDAIMDRLAESVEAVDINMLAPDATQYDRLACPHQPKGAFEAMIEFARRARESIPLVRMIALANPQTDLAACRRLAEEELRLRFAVASSS